MLRHRSAMLVLPALITATALGSPARADALDDLSRATWRLGVSALDAVDATPAQRRAVANAARSLGHRLAPYEDDAIDWARALHRAWTADVVTRPAVEDVRVKGVELLDATSAEAVDFVVDVAGTLTPQQRAELAREIQDAAIDLIRDHRRRN